MAEFQTMVQCLQYWTEKLGDAPTFIFRNRLHERYVLTWNKLYALSGRFAAVLHGWGLTRGHLVVNTLPNSPERVVCEAGILMSGAASVNGQCLLADGSDLLRTLRVSRASAIVVDPDVDNSPWDALKRYVSVSDEGNSVTSESLPELRKVYFVRRVEDNTSEDFLSTLEIHADWFELDDIASSDVMSVFSTSGSTGFSKLVPFTHRLYLNFNKSYQAFTGGKMLLNTSPLGWLGGYFALSLPSGSKRVLCDIRGGGFPENTAEFIWRTIQEEKCTMAMFSPVFLPQLVEMGSVRVQRDRENTEISSYDLENRGDMASKRKETSTGKYEAVKGTDESDCPRKSRGQTRKQYVVNDCNHAHEDENNTQRDGSTFSSAHNLTDTVEGQENTDNTSATCYTSAVWRPDVIILSGLPVTRSMVQKALVLADTVVVRYGATDFGFVSLLAVRNGDDYVDHDCGLKGVGVKIVRQDDEDVEVPANQLGHILVRTQPVPADSLCPGKIL